MAHIGVCKRCGKETQYRFASRVRDYCSHACSNATKAEVRQWPEKIRLGCRQCGESFFLTEAKIRSRQRSAGAPTFCSLKCSIDASKYAAQARRQPIVCAHCGSSFYRDRKPRSQKSYCGKECLAAAQKKTLQRELTEEQKSKAKEYIRAYILKNREKINAASREWAKKNRAYRNFIQQARRGGPSRKDGIWSDELTKLVSLEANRLAALRGSATGFKWHVDHIVPLRGKNVCGFHIWSNLRVIPARENQRKGNRVGESLDGRFWL